MNKISKILVVDDSETNVLLLQRLLEEEGYKIDYAYSGKAAIELIKKKTFDLILLDIMMPGIDGFDILEKIKGTQYIQNTPIIMVTAKDDHESQQKAIKMGANDYMTKPLDLEKLKKLIQKYN
jgi:CheY-like chemotaxis protein